MTGVVLGDVMLRDEAHFQSVIERFRRAALDETDWEGALAGLSEACSATSANLVGVSSGVLQFIWADNLDPAMLVDLDEAVNSVDLNPRLRLAARAAPFERVEGYDFGSDDLTRRFPVFGEVCRRYDVGFGALMNLETTGSNYVGLALLRGAGQGHGSPKDGDALTVLAPHLLDAVRLRRAIEDQGALIGCGAMESLRAAAFFCDGLGRVVRSTAAAEALVGAGGPLKLSNGVLSCSSVRATQQLQQALAAVLGDPARPTRILALPCGDPGRMVAEVAALPVPRGALDFAPRAIITVRRKRPVAPVDLIALTLGLTPAEAAVSRLIAMGLSRAEIAERRDTSLDTIRAQLKSVFAKLGVSREVDLVIQINDLS